MTTTAHAVPDCDGCSDIVRYARERGVFGVPLYCDACGGYVTVPRTDAPRLTAPPPAPAAALPRNPELALLKDCARVARYDAAHRPRSGFPTSPLDNAGVRASVPNGDPPAWMQDRGGTLDDARALRQRLDRLAARARAHAATLDPNAPRSPSVADVLEWLVAHARALLDSAGTQGVPLDKRLPDLLAEAFAGPARWAQWHPVEPPRLTEPAKQPAPAAPPRFQWKHRAPRKPAPLPTERAPTPYEREQHARARAAYPREARAHRLRLGQLRARHLVLVLGWCFALARWSERQARWTTEQARHRDAVREHKARLAQGDTARRVFGADLLASVLRVWFTETG